MRGGIPLRHKHSLVEKKKVENLTILYLLQLIPDSDVTNESKVHIYVMNIFNILIHYFISD